MKLSEHASLNGPLSEADLVDTAGQVGGGTAARVVPSTGAASSVDLLCCKESLCDWIQQQRSLDVVH
jgi:hypothetical protein